MGESSAVTVRTATSYDAAACAAIYAPYVERTAVTFETDPPTPAEFADRIAAVADDYGWLVAERAGDVVGYAYAHRFSERAAYDWACETSVYVGWDERGHGAGRALYAGLLAGLEDRGYYRALAAIAMPNEASVRLHRAFGFQEAGLHRRVGWKHGAWHDVAWFQRDLQAAESDPPAPVRAGTAAPSAPPSDTACGHLWQSPSEPNSSRNTPDARAGITETVRPGVP